MHSAAQHEGVFGTAAPCTRGNAGRWPATSEATAEATAKAGDPWNGGVGPVARDAVNPSMGAWPRHPCRGHPRNRTHPAFDRFPRSVDPRHAWMNLCQTTKSIWGQSRFPLENGSDPRTPCRSRINPTVTGKLSKVGRCGLAGPLAPWMAPSSPPWKGLRRVLPVHTAPPNQQKTRAALALALALALASAVAGQRPALPAGAGRSPAAPPAHENDFTDFSKPSFLRHASTILRSSMRPRATHAKNRPPIA